MQLILAQNRLFGVMICMMWPYFKFLSQKYFEYQKDLQSQNILNNVKSEFWLLNLAQ